MAETPNREKIVSDRRPQLNLMNMKNWFSVQFAAENDKRWVSNKSSKAITNRCSSEEKLFVKCNRI